MHLLEVAETPAFACTFVSSCYICNEKMKFTRCKHNYFHLTCFPLFLFSPGAEERDLPLSCVISKG